MSKSPGLSPLAERALSSSLEEKDFYLSWDITVISSEVLYDDTGSAQGLPIASRLLIVVTSQDNLARGMPSSTGTIDDGWSWSRTRWIDSQLECQILSRFIQLYLRTEGRANFHVAQRKKGPVASPGFSESCPATQGIWLIWFESSAGSTLSNS